MWLVVRDRAVLRLASVIYSTVWEPGREQVASCRSATATAINAPWEAEPAPHAAPHIRCSCGIYAARSVTRAASYIDGCGPGTDEPVFRVIGLVSLWGRVVEAEHGYRASRAYPARLYVPAVGLNGALGASPERVARDLAAYGVPVELVDGRTTRHVTEALAA